MAELCQIDYNTAMNMTFTINEIVLFLIALIAVFSPFGVIGPYSVITRGFSRKIQGKITTRVSLYSVFILLVTAWAGEAVLKYLGISIEALGAAGGLVLILTSLPMIMKGESPRKKVKTDDSGDEHGHEDEDEGWETMIVSPLVFPITVGAGSISLVITQASMVENILDRLALSAVIIIHGFVIHACYLFSVPLSRRMGGRGSAVITRVGGIILLSLAFIIFTNGLKVLLPGLAG